MDAHSHRCLLTLVAVLAITLLAAGCGDTLTGPDPAAIDTIQLALVESSPVEIAFKAVVTAVTDPQLLLGGSISVGDSVSGSVLYDEYAIDLDKKPYRGRYLFETAPFGMVMDIAGLQFRSDPELPELSIRLDNAEPTDKKRDSARFSSAANLEVLSGVGVDDMSIFLTDQSATALSSDRLDGSDPYHAEWPTKRQITITGSAGWQIVAEIGSIVDPGDEELPDIPENNSKLKFHFE